MEPTSTSLKDEICGSSLHNDRPGTNSTFTYAVIAEHRESEQQGGEPTRQKRTLDDELTGDNEIITNVPLLHRTSSTDGDAEIIKEVPNSRSESTSVRFDGILLDVLNPTTIHVDWCPISLSNSEPVCGYKIRYAAKDISSYNEIFVTPGISNYTITGLRPNTEYDISVNAVDERDNVIQTCGWVRQKTDELEDGQSKTYEAPYLTAVAAIALLLVAVVVPFTFLFVRNCGQCTTSNTTEKQALGKDQNKIEEDYLLQDSFRHRRDMIDISFKSHEIRRMKRKRRDVKYKHNPILLNRTDWIANKLLLS